MSSVYEHPNLSMYVTPEQRDRAEQWLQEAYADNRITESEFDHRIGQVIGAVTRKDLNVAFYGLVQVPMASRAMGVHSAYAPLIRPETRQQAGHGVAAFAHFSGLVFWILGPGLVYAVSNPGSYARKEAAKAFNFQLILAVSFATVAIAAAVTHLHVLAWLLPVLIVGGFLLTIIGGAKALQGEDWRNPAKSVLKLEVLPEK